MKPVNYAETAIRHIAQAKINVLKKEVYRKYPLIWMEERLLEKSTEFEWSKIEAYNEHQWDGDVDVLAKAWNDVAQGKWVGIEAATGTSKTYWLARLVMWFLDCYEGALVVTSAPKQDQLKLNLWSEIGRIMHKFKRLRHKSMLYNLRLVVEDVDFEALELNEVYSSNSWHAVGFIAGVGSAEESAGRARGFHRKDMLIILEECPAMPMPVLTAFQNTCTGKNNIIVAVGNPDNEFDPLHQFCMQPTVSNYRISALDYPNVVMHNEAFQGAVTQDSIDRRRETYGTNSPMFQAMVRGISPTQGKDSLIRLEWVEQCIDLELDRNVERGYSACGVDAANSEEGDKAAVAYGRGGACTYLKEFQCPNATHLGYNLIYDQQQLLAKGYEVYGIPTIHTQKVGWGCIGVDAVGIGVATINVLLDEGLDVQVFQGAQWDEAVPLDEENQPIYKFNSLRAQIYWEAREDLRQKKVSIRLEDKQTLAALKKQLTVPRFNVRSANIEIEKKDDIKKRSQGKSPNLADVFCYWNFARKGYRLGAMALDVMGG